MVPYSDSSILNDGNTASTMNIRCHRFLALLLLPLIFRIATPAFAQAPVVASPDPESLFTSADAGLNANKQVVLYIVRDLLEANHWSDADKYISERYLQHNPFVASGLAPVKRFFAERPAAQIPAKMKTKVVSVVTEGDLVVVAFKQ